MPIDHDRIARELVRALRGRRSQRDLSRRLGYASSVVSAWERGVRHPTASDLMRLAKTVGRDPRAIVAGFSAALAEGLGRLDPARPRGAAKLVELLRGEHRMEDLAGAVGVSRFALLRWSSAQAEPRLSQWLRLVDAATGRLVELVECFCDPRQVPTIRAAWERRDTLVRLIEEQPAASAIRVALSLDAYAAMARPPRGWLGRRVGVDADEEERCLRALEAAGAVRFDGTHWRDEAPPWITVQPGPRGREGPKRYWNRRAAAQVGLRGDDRFSYLVFAGTHEDAQKIRAAQREFLEAIRRIADTASRPHTRVLDAQAQLFDLAEVEDDPQPRVRASKQPPPARQKQSRGSGGGSGAREGSQTGAP